MTLPPLAKNRKERGTQMPLLDRAWVAPPPTLAIPKPIPISGNSPDSPPFS